MSLTVLVCTAFCRQERALLLILVNVHLWAFLLFCSCPVAGVANLQVMEM